MQRIASANLPAKAPQTCERTNSVQVYDRGVMVVSVCLLAAGALACGCARDDGRAEVPAPCLRAAAPYVEALAGAPSAVRLDGVPISDCLAKDASQGDVQAVGSLVLQAAQRLGDEERALAAGYLVGALRRGSARTQGIHAEIVRRVEQEVAPLASSAAFERGQRAGRTSG